MWYPPEMWEAHGPPWEAYVGGGSHYHWNPAAEVVCERFCLACACSQRADEDTPCWNCGGETQPGKPHWWPSSASAVTVRNGDVWSPGEEEVDAAS